MEKEIDNHRQINTFSFPQFYFPEEENSSEIKNENENENENENVEKEIPQNGEQEGENIEEIPLRRSTRVTQSSTRLRDFISYEVKYLIQNFLL
jgi:hypothetical protein